MKHLLAKDSTTRGPGSCFLGINEIQEGQAGVLQTQAWKRRIRRKS